MKFSEDKSPILKSVSQAKKTPKSLTIRCGVEIADGDTFSSGQYIASTLGHILKEGNVMCFSRDISSKICLKSFSFLKTIKPFLSNCDISGSGIIIRPIFVLSETLRLDIQLIDLAYIFYTKPDGVKYFDIYVVFDGDVICFNSVAFVNPGEEKFNMVPFYPTSQCVEYFDPVALVLSIVKLSPRYFLDFCIHHHIFKKFAPTETVVINPGAKRVLAGGEKHVNESETHVTHIDSKWFRNIVRLEGFAVRGHFRLQPKKVNGEWTKELIWINDFEKHGYTSKARILNQNPTND